MPRVAVQLYTLRQECQKDFIAVLESVGRMGFDGVEFAGYWGIPPRDLRQILDKLGLVAVSTHVGLETIREQFPEVVRDAKTLGCTYVTVPAPPADFHGTEAAWRILREELRFYHDLLRHNSLALCYHNHAREFEATDHFVPFEWFFAQRDSFFCQLDVYWAKFAGRDPVSLLEQLGSQCPMIHVKDMAGDESRRDEVPGYGCLDWPAIFAAAQRSGTQWLIVEQDNPQGDALEAVARALRFVRAATFA